MRRFLIALAISLVPSLALAGHGHMGGHMGGHIGGHMGGWGGHPRAAMMVAGTVTGTMPLFVMEGSSIATIGSSL
jgi:hypothetical protein